jgi:predicted O-methyltransferase YrrM
VTKFFKNLFRLLLINTPFFIILNYVKNFLPNYKTKNRSLKIEKKTYNNFISLDPNKKWFCNNLNFLTNNLNNLDNINNILEIGSYEGRSAIFFLKKFLKSNISCVDTWSGSDEHDKIEFTNIEKNFDLNTNYFIKQNRLKKLKMTSNEYFENNNEKFDLIYVDGDHNSKQVSLDIENSWNILNKGGYLILDDYMWWYYKDLKKNPSSPINEFIINNINEISNLTIWQQVIIKKVN